MKKMKKHFMVVAFPSQGNLNPAFHLAERLAAATAATVTFSTAISAHRRMSTISRAGEVSFSPFSWGDDSDGPAAKYFITPRASREASRNLSELLSSLAAAGRPVTAVLHHLVLHWAAEVAGGHGVLAVPYWTQPAALLSMHYHYFHGGFAGGGADILVDDFQRLPASVSVRDLPPEFTTTTGEDAAAPHPVVAAFGETFKLLDDEASRRRPVVVLVNSFDALEDEALSAPIGKIDMVGVGPLIGGGGGGGVDIFEADDAEEYLAWLDEEEEESVVYVSFGSLVVLGGRQAAEIAAGMAETGRPFLWAARGLPPQVDGVSLSEGGGSAGKVVGWCEQAKVLQHPAIGCFVTHCGWNSTVEGLAAGVPMVALPQFSDQMANAAMLEGVWGAGVRAAAASTASSAAASEYTTTSPEVVPAAELRRCIELVMGEGGKEMRRRAGEWKLKAQAAVSGGSSVANLEAFLANLEN